MERVALADADADFVEVGDFVTEALPLVVGSKSVAVPEAEGEGVAEVDTRRLLAEARGEGVPATEGGVDAEALREGK